MPDGNPTDAVLHIGQAESPDSRSQQLRVFYELQRTRLCSRRMIWLLPSPPIGKLSLFLCLPVSPAKHILTR
jgi:hypothetical protein